MTILCCDEVPKRGNFTTSILEFFLSNILRLHLSRTAGLSAHEAFEDLKHNLQVYFFMEIISLL
jgi:hypothetical protein